METKAIPEDMNKMGNSPDTTCKVNFNSNINLTWLIHSTHFIDYF